MRARKKLLAVVLTLAMALSLVPVVAAAATTGTDTDAHKITATITDVKFQQDEESGTKKDSGKVTFKVTLADGTDSTDAVTNLLKDKTDLKLSDIFTSLTVSLKNGSSSVLGNTVTASLDTAVSAASTDVTVAVTGITEASATEVDLTPSVTPAGKTGTVTVTTGEDPNTTTVHYGFDVATDEVTGTAGKYTKPATQTTTPAAFGTGSYADGALKWTYTAENSGTVTASNFKFTVDGAANTSISAETDSTATNGYKATFAQTTAEQKVVITYGSDTSIKCEITVPAKTTTTEPGTPTASITDVAYDTATKTLSWTCTITGGDAVAVDSSKFTVSVGGTALQSPTITAGSNGKYSIANIEQTSSSQQVVIKYADTTNKVAEVTATGTIAAAGSSTGPTTTLQVTSATYNSTNDSLTVQWTVTPALDRAQDFEVEIDYNDTSKNSLLSFSVYGPQPTAGVATRAQATRVEATVSGGTYSVTLPLGGKVPAGQHSVMVVLPSPLASASTNFTVTAATTPTTPSTGGTTGAVSGAADDVTADTNVTDIQKDILDSVTVSGNANASTEEKVEELGKLMGEESADSKKLAAAVAELDTTVARAIL